MNSITHAGPASSCAPGTPLRVVPNPVVPSDADLLECMSRCIFEAGFNPLRVDAKWPGIRQAFFEFNVEALCGLSSEETDAIVENPAVIRNRAKVRAVVDNARITRAIAAERGSLAAWLQELPVDPVARGTAVASLFKRMGPWAAQRFLALQDAWLESPPWPR